MIAALPVFAAAIFAGAGGLAVAAIVAEVAPQWRRIASLAAGRRELLP